MEKTIIVAAKDTPKEKIKFAISSIEELQIEIKRRFDLGNQDTISIFDAEGISVGNFGSISTGDSLLFEITSTNLVKAKKTPLNSEAKKKLLDSLYKICAHIVGKGEKRCRIVLLGASGAGKSSTINSLFGKEVLTTSDKAACTTIPIAKEVRVANTDLILELIDTPGLKDEYGRDDEFISLIQQFLSGKEIHCVLYVHDMAKTRFDSTDFEVVKKLDTALGTKIWNNVIVVLTRANAVDSFPKPDDITIADWHATPKIDKWNSYSKTCKANVRNKFRQILGSNSDVRIALVDNITFERDSNGNSLLVDGTMWKEKLVTKVLETMDALGALTLAPQLINSPDEEIVVPAVKHTKTLLQRLKTVFSFLQEIPPVIKSAWDFIVDLKKYFK